jgi:hypothetical protein
VASQGLNSMQLGAITFRVCKFMIYFFYKFVSIIIKPLTISVTPPEGYAVGNAALWD